MFNLFKNKNVSGQDVIDKIQKALHEFIDPVSNKDLMTSNVVESIVFKDGNVKIIIEASKENANLYEELSAKIEAGLLKIKGVAKVLVIVTEHLEASAKSPVNMQSQEQSKPARPAPNISSIRPENIGKIIAVSSGKGGVGKSTIAFNLAIALVRAGFKVGILDADIFGPSIPTFMGETNTKAEIGENKKILPIEKYGLKAMSIGYLVEKDKALIWRGPMVMKSLVQLFQNVEWGELDYLILDLPPGTGDVPLTLAQQARIDGVVIVSTPQELALADVRRGIELFQKANVKIIGMVENMSILVDEETGVEIDLYGRGGAQNVAKERGLNFLGEVCFFPMLRELSDEGELAEGKLLNEQFDEIADLVVKMA